MGAGRRLGCMEGESAQRQLPVIKYTRKDTGDVLQGDEARVLTMRNYGPGEWWLLLDPA